MHLEGCPDSGRRLCRRPERRIQETPFVHQTCDEDHGPGVPDHPRHVHDHPHHHHHHATEASASAIMIELREHVPFSVAATAIGIMAAGVICLLLSAMGAGDAAGDAHDHGGQVAAVVPHDHDGDGVPDHGPDEHEDPLAHDHDGDGIPDHGPDEHEDPLAHDHDGDGIPDQGTDAHGGEEDHADHDHPGGEQVAGSHDADDGHGHDHDSPATQFFHLFHPAHMLFSAVATTAMFARYERRKGKAIFIGLLGAIGVCGMSDIVMPQLSLYVLGYQTPWHVCILEEPGLVLPFALLGVVIGAVSAGGVARSTVFSHSLHVLTSTMASIFYMVGPIGLTSWIDIVGQVFLFVVIAVTVPCCLSDIVFPLFMSKAAREKFDLEPHVH